MMSGFLLFTSLARRRNLRPSCTLSTYMAITSMFSSAAMNSRKSAPSRTAAFPKLTALSTPTPRDDAYSVMRWVITPL